MEDLAGVVGSRVGEGKEPPPLRLKGTTGPRSDGFLPGFLERRSREFQQAADAGLERLVSECRLDRFLGVLLERQASLGAMFEHFDLEVSG
jgi:hypothetical protein